MTTNMHRLPVSLREEQVEYLAERARREGASVAEVIRQLVDRERVVDDARGDRPDPIWDIAGMIKEELPLIGGQAVSEHPDLYIAETILPSRVVAPKKARRRRRAKGAGHAARTR